MPPGREEFREMLSQNADEAMKKYSLLIDCESLDYVTNSEGATTFDEFKLVDVVFEYMKMGQAHVILMRAKKGSDTDGKEIAYLPWKNAASGAVSKATLDGTGPAYFSTSQLDGCRFTLQYHDSDGKKVTVLHLAGDHGGPGKKGSEARDLLESTALGDLNDPARRRRFSIGGGPGKLGKIGGQFKASRADTTYYEGGKAAVFGYRNSKGSWVFYGQDMKASNEGLGLKNLGTGASVSESLNTNAQR